MTSPVDAGFPARRARRLPPVASLPFANRPSFAVALRQRGLLARAIQPAGVDGDRSGIADSWLAVAAVFEAHRDREEMERVLAVLRGDVVAA
jgi:hypothetical protein